LKTFLDTGKWATALWEAEQSEFFILEQVFFPKSFIFFDPQVFFLIFIDLH
jgi:hypothetical protein